ncbi:MAG: addiction module protein [Bacteroidota bacterium]
MTVEELRMEILQTVNSTEDVAVLQQMNLILKNLSENRGEALTVAQQTELSRRMERHKAGTEADIPWEEVRAKFQ